MASRAGTSHPAVIELRRLSGRRSARQDAGRFVIDGPVLLAEALAAGVRVERVFAEPDADDAVLTMAADAGARVVPVHAGVLAKTTSPLHPQPVAAIAVIPADAADAAGRGGVPLVLVLVDVADPGNAGTLLRVAEAAGASAVAFAGDAVERWNPKVVRASAGSVFRMATSMTPDPDTLVAELRGRGLTIVVAAGGAGVPPEAVDLTRPVALVVGNEAHGVRPRVVAAADAVVSIPMAGAVESLNVAMAGTVLAFEAARQRRQLAPTDQPGAGLSES